MYFSLIALFFSISRVYSREILNPRPIIGILTQECDESYGCEEGKGYVASSYIKFLESAGAQVYIVPMKTSDADLRELMSDQLSGILLPGGDSFDETTDYGRMTKLVWDVTTNGTCAVPVWATCLGMEALATYAKGSRSKGEICTDEIEGLHDIGLSICRFFSK